MRRMLVASVTLALAACSSPPKPPVVDGSNRQTINDPATVELLALRAQVAEARTQMAETQRQLEQARLQVERAKADMVSTHAQITQVRAAPPEPAKVQPVARAEAAPAVTVFRYQFPYNSSTLALTPTQKAELLPKAHSAERIEIRGRTDGQRPSAGDEAVAKARALAARSLLIANGVSPEKMAINYVSATDYVADNYSPAGRAQNRRVEIEVVQQLKGK